MIDKIIFAYGVFVTLLLIGGLIYTIREFREMDRHPENYKPKYYGSSKASKERQSV